MTIRCAFCGEVVDLTSRSLYVGGGGYQVTVECRSKPACWLRQDAQRRAGAPQETRP